MSWNAWERERRGGGGGDGREKRKHHGNVIQTLLNLSKAFIFGQPQSATRTAVNKEKNGKLQAKYNIRWHGNWTKCPNASNTNSRERGRCGQLRDFTPCTSIHFAFLFLVSSGSYHICLRAQRNEHHIWQDIDEASVAAFKKHQVIINCRERSITRQCLAVPKPALHFPDDNGQSFHFLAE